MAAFRGFVIKEFKQIYRDKRSLIVLFGMPVIMMLLFGFAIRNEISEVQIAVLDYSKSESSVQFIQKLSASNSFYMASILSSYDEVEPEFKAGNLKAVVVFPESFGTDLATGKAEIQNISDATDPNLSNLIRAYISNIARDFSADLNIQANQMKPGINPAFFMMYNPQLESVNLFVPGLIAVILMLISALMTSISITKEKEMGNMEVLLVSPLKPHYIIIGKVLPYLVLSAINVVTILLLARYIFEVPFAGSLLFFFIEAILFILTALALGVFISSVANNQQTAMMASLAGLLLPTVLLSGFIFPIESMPLILQYISHLIPAKWFLVIVRGIMLKGSDLLMLWEETLILFLMTIFFMMVSYKKFNVRLQ